MLGHSQPQPAEWLSHRRGRHTSDAETGWKILSWLWENKGGVRQKLAEIYAWFRGSGSSDERRPGILILGPGGSGKTTLARLLAGEYDFLFDSPSDYDESLEIEKYSLKDDPDFEVVVPPGQEKRREATWPYLHADIAAGKFRGVILLAPDGHHSLGQISYQDHKLYQGNKDEFIKALLAHNRAEELEVLRRLAPHVGANRGKMWLLTVVAKQDLWWPKRGEVERHYREGEYGAEIQKLLSQQGHRQLRHEFAFVSLVIGNFTTARHERLKPNVEGYDHPLQVESLRRLFETVDALKNWEAGT